MSGRHSEQKKEMHAEQTLYTRGRGSGLKRQRYRSSSRDRYERSPDRSDYHSKKERSKERDYHHDRDYSSRTKQSRRSKTSDAEKEQPQTESAVGAYYKLDTNEPFDRNSSQREWQGKGKGSLPAKSTKSMSYFANDGSFLDSFKKMQEEEKKHGIPQESAPSGSAVAPAAAVGAPAPPPICVGRRRGVKILKTGRVPKLQNATKKSVDPEDFWSVYQAEVDKYNTTGCEKENGPSKLVK